MSIIQTYAKQGTTFIFASFILFFTNNGQAQETLKCNSSNTEAKLVFVSKMGDIINLKLYWDEKTIFSEEELFILNGTCESCPKAGGPNREHGTEMDVQIKQTNTTKPTTIRWSDTYCGTSQSMIVDAIELKCKSSPTGAKLVWISNDDDIITFKMYWDEGTVFVGTQSLDITNGECLRCQRVGGVNRPDGKGGKRRPNGKVQFYKVKRIDASKPVIIKWVGAYCGKESLVIP